MKQKLSTILLIVAFGFISNSANSSCSPTSAYVETVSWDISFSHGITFCNRVVYECSDGSKEYRPTHCHHMW